jgi:hypothetical protein
LATPKEPRRWEEEGAEHAADLRQWGRGGLTTPPMIPPDMVPVGDSSGVAGVLVAVGRGFRGLGSV